MCTDLLPLLHEHLQSLCGLFRTVLGSLGFVLSLCVIQVYTEVKSHIHQSSHQLHRCNADQKENDMIYFTALLLTPVLAGQ